MQKKDENYAWAAPKFADARMMILPVDSINTDYSYQRPLQTKKVMHYANDWDYFQSGSFHVVQRPDHTFWIVDGNHRLHAARKRGDVKDVRCLVIDSPGIEWEAVTFNKLQIDKVRVTAIQRYTALVVGKDPLALRIKSVLDYYNIGVSPKKDNTGTQEELVAISSLMEIADRFTDVELKAVIALSRKIADGKMIPGWLMLGVAELLVNPGVEFFSDRRIERLKRCGLKMLAISKDATMRQYNLSTRMGARNAMLEEANRHCQEANRIYLKAAST